MSAPSQFAETPRIPRNLRDELGRTGVLEFSGYVYEEALQALQLWRGQRVYREMADGDSTIGGILFAIEQLVRQVEWHVDPAAKGAAFDDAAQLVDECLGDMSITWQDTLAEVLSMLIFGWSYVEQVYKYRDGDNQDPQLHSKYRDGRIGWASWGIRAQETLMRWEFSPSGGLLGLWQLPPPDYILRFIPIEKSLLFRTTSRKGNPEGFSLLRRAYQCYSDDTELLTRAGWRSIAAITLDDELATLNQATHILEYQRPSALHCYPYDGELEHIHSRRIDQLVTPNHQVYVRPYHAQTWTFKDASTVKHTATYKRDAQWVGAEQGTFLLPAVLTKQGRELPARPIPMDDWLRFLGIYLSEGCVHRKSTGNRQAYVALTQKRGPKLETMQQWVRAVVPSAVNVSTREDGVSQLTITSLQLWSYLRQFGKSPNKYVPSFIKDLTPRQIRIFLDAYALGDGAMVGVQVRNGRLSKGTRIYYSTSRRMIDDLSELILKVGDVATIIRHRPKGGFGTGCWRVSQGTPTSGGYKATHHDKVPYTGNVYCVTVDNHTLYARRNGKACWSGNSWYMRQNIQRIEAIGIERDAAGIPVVYVPPEILASSAQLQPYKDLVSNIRNDEQAGVVLPMVYDQDGHKMYELSLLSSGGSRQFDTNAVIQRYRGDIAQSLLADFILLGHEGVGSYSLSHDKTQLFQQALTALLDTIAAVVNRFAIPRLLRLNGLDVSKGTPALAHGDITTPDLGQLGAYLQALTSAGIPIASMADSKWLLEVAGVPTVETRSGPDQPDVQAPEGAQQPAQPQEAQQGEGSGAA